MKKILIVVTKGEMGGAQVFVSTLAQALHRQGHHVTIAVGEGEYLKGTLKKVGIPVLEFKRLRRTKNPLSNILFTFEMRTFLNLNQFDVVHFNSSNALFGAIGAHFAYPRPKTVFTVHGLSLLDEHYKASKLVKNAYAYIFGFLLRFIDETVFVSRTNFEYAKRIGLVQDGTVIYNGIDTEHLHFLAKGPARAFLENLSQADMEGKYIIGSIGRLAYPKNYEFLIEIFPKVIKEIPNAIAVIIGEGPERKKYERLIERSGLQNNVYLVGEMTDAYRYIKAFDLFVLPSEYEGMSMTLIEAMFAEVPILASRVGGTPELLENPRTYILNDKEDFLSKLRVLGEQKEHAYSEIQRLHRSQFDGNKMATQYEKIYG